MHPDQYGVSAWVIPLVDEAIDQGPHPPPRGFDAFVPCRASVVPPDRRLHRRGHPPRHRRQAGSPWRKLNCSQQALLVLAYLRKGETFAELAAGFGIGTATAWRYVTETVALLAARAPKLRRALRDANDAGHTYLAIDGTLIPIGRVAADRPFYSGKHRKHGMNLHPSPAPAATSCGSPGRCPARCTT